MTTVERNKLSIRDKHFNKSARENPPPPTNNIPSHTNWALTVNKHWPLWGSAQTKTVPRDPARRNVENIYTRTAARDKNRGLGRRVMYIIIPSFTSRVLWVRNVLCSTVFFILFISYF